MPLDVMDSNQWLLRRIGDCLRLCNAYKERAHQARPIGNAYSVDFVKRDLCFCQRSLDYLINLLNMLSGCDFRDNAPIERVERNL